MKALALPVDNLVSNWVSKVMASLAWTLNVWSALWPPESGRWADAHAAEKQRLLKMEFSTYLPAMLQLPCQIVRTGGRVVCRLPTIYLLRLPRDESWNAKLHTCLGASSACGTCSGMLESPHGWQESFPPRASP